MEERLLKLSGEMQLLIHFLIMLKMKILMLECGIMEEITNL
jgi:hypothetical protein